MLNETKDPKERQRELEYQGMVHAGKLRYTKERSTRGESETAPAQEQLLLLTGPLSEAIQQFVEKALGKDTVEDAIRIIRRQPNKDERAALRALSQEERKERRRAQVRAAHERQRTGGSECAGRKFHVAKYLLRILPEQAASLTIRYGIDAAASNMTANTAGLSLGTAVADHIELMALDDEAPALYRKVIEQVQKATTEWHRRGVLRHVVAKYLGERLKWDKSEKMEVGIKLLELFQDSACLIELRRHSEGRHNTPEKVFLTSQAEAWFAHKHEVASLLRPVHMPMVCPPRLWRTEERVDADGTIKRWISGGYLTRALPPRARSMVQSRLPGALSRLVSGDISNVYRAVNAIQSTPWRINKSVLSIAEECFGRPGFHHLFSKSDKILPPRPACLTHVSEEAPSKSLTPEQREALIEWKKGAAPVYDFNARQTSKRAAAAKAITTAARFRDEEVLYFPHYLDFRGRVYPFANYLNPQSADVGRALLEFAEGKPLGESGMYWLKVHIANLFGIDKVSFEDRVKWVNDNLEKLLDSATQPLDGQMFWTTADSPWSALAACLELAGSLVAGQDYVSHLPIAMDGSCSGLQHYSAMLRDPVGGAAVNLVPAEKPGDIYTQVAGRAQALSDGSGSALSEAWKGRVTRPIAKRPTMTMCYSATVYGMQGQIAGVVEDLGGSEYLRGEDVRHGAIYMAQTIWKAIGEVVVAARAGMDFLQQCAAVMSEQEKAICWTAPSGFLVEQGYRKVQSERVEINYRGRRLRLSLAQDIEALDPKRQMAGVAPNFVHSMDSAHLMATVNRGVEEGLNHWACIHDSFGVHAADVVVLNACIREAFIEQYSPNVLEKFREEIVGQLPPELAEKVPLLPPQGSLDLEAVREAAYFFA